MAKVGTVLSFITLNLFNCLLATGFVSAERSIKLPVHEASIFFNGKQGQNNMSHNYILKASNFLRQPIQSGYEHVWPEMKFGWEIVVGSIVGAIGAAFGSAGGIGGGGVFVPMLILIIGFDPKSSIAMSKCMIMGTTLAVDCYNLKRRHPTLDMPIIDYDLVLLIQPMLLLGISFGVALSIVFPDWIVTVLFIILCLGTCAKAIFKGIETWKKETILRKEIAKHLESTGSSSEQGELYKPLCDGPSRTEPHKDGTKTREVSILQNLHWKEIGLLVFVWVAFLLLQIAKNSTSNCSTAYWVLNLLQIPVSVGVYVYEAVSLYKGRRVIATRGDQLGINWRVHRLVFISACGFFGGMIAGLLGIGGGFVMGPLFLELGVPPQVSTASAIFGMTFSSSLSAVEYYMLNRFPVPYALYFVVIAGCAAYLGQRVMDRVIKIFGRASLIIFVLAFSVFVSCIALGGIGIANMIEKIKRHEYMGFEDFCNNDGFGMENVVG